MYQSRWFTGVPLETIRIDPTRMAQGIMTGIGFLGAGVIFKEGVTVRGLTTAASIWITAALGILYGAGFYFPAVLGTVAALGVLAAFRWLERRMPSQFFAALTIRFAREKAPTEPDLRKLLGEQGFNVATMSYRLEDAGNVFEYETVIRTLEARNAENLATYLLGRDGVIEFRITPTVN